MEEFLCLIKQVLAWWLEEVEPGRGIKQGSWARGEHLVQVTVVEGAEQVSGRNNFSYLFVIELRSGSI